MLACKKKWNRAPVPIAFNKKYRKIAKNKKFTDDLKRLQIVAGYNNCILANLINWDLNFFHLYGLQQIQNFLFQNSYMELETLLCKPKFCKPQLKIAQGVAIWYFTLLLSV